MYGFGDRLLMVASDRISAFDVVLPTPIPDKGRVLTGALEVLVRAAPSDLVPNHLSATDLADFPPEAQGAPDLAGRSMLVNAGWTMLPIECVVRGYLVGSGWKDYRRTGTVCGHSAARTGCVEAEKLPEADLHAVDQGDRRPRRRTSTATPASLLVGEERFDRLAELSIQIYRRPPSTPSSAASSSPTPSSSSARATTGRIVLGDEALTPDSSRFWPADEYATGGSPPSYDKQYVRDWLETLDWDKTPPGPEIPAGGRRGHAGPLRRGLRAADRRAVRRVHGRSRGGPREGERHRPARARASSTPRARPCAGRSPGSATTSPTCARARSSTSTSRPPTRPTPAGSPTRSPSACSRTR